jgi:ribosomal protein S7
MTELKQNDKNRKSNNGWVNPLAKYDNIPPQIVARTMGNYNNAINLKDPEKRIKMIDNLVNGADWKTSKEDAELFCDNIINMSDKERAIAKKRGEIYD